MKRYRLLAAVLILLLACGLQFWLGSAGIFINLILASLIAFAFFFSFLELAVFVLFAVFVVNWQPAPSLTIVFFALIPVAAFVLHRLSAWTPWAGIPVMIVCGLVVFYLAVAPGFFATDPAAFVLDLVGSLVFGELTLVALNKAER